MEPTADRATSREERDLVKRLAEFPGVVAEATERRAPHALPNYAIRVADDFTASTTITVIDEGVAQPFRLGLVVATKAVITQPRPDRRRSTDRM